MGIGDKDFLTRRQASGVGGARLEGWPPLFPDATVRGEDENIRHGLWHERKARTQLTGLN